MIIVVFTISRDLEGEVRSVDHFQRLSPFPEKKNNSIFNSGTAIGIKITFKTVHKNCNPEY